MKYLTSSGQDHCYKLEGFTLFHATTLKELGLQSHSDIMALRIACITFDAEQPSKIASACKPPTFDIPKSVLECYLEEDFTISEIASMMSVSESTIYRRMRLYGQSKLEFYDISDEELDHATLWRVTFETVIVW